MLAKAKEEFFPKPKVDGAIIKRINKPLTHYKKEVLHLLQMFLYPRKSLRAVSKKLKLNITENWLEKRPNKSYDEFDELYRLNF